MYSILIRQGDKTFIYATTKNAEEEEVVFTGNTEETKAFYFELLEKYPSSKLVIIHNTEVTSDITISDVQ